MLKTSLPYMPNDDVPLISLQGKASAAESWPNRSSISLHYTAVCERPRVVIDGYVRGQCTHKGLARRNHRVANKAPRVDMILIDRRHPFVTVMSRRVSPSRLDLPHTSRGRSPHMGSHRRQRSVAAPSYGWMRILPLVIPPIKALSLLSERGCWRLPAM